MLSAASSSPSSPSNKSLSDPSSEENEADAEGDGDESGSHSRYTSPAHSPFGFPGPRKSSNPIGIAVSQNRRTPRASRGSVCGGDSSDGISVSIKIPRLVNCASLLTDGSTTLTPSRRWVLEPPCGRGKNGQRSLGSCNRGLRQHRLQLRRDKSDSMLVDSVDHSSEVLGLCDRVRRNTRDDVHKTTVTGSKRKWESDSHGTHMAMDVDQNVPESSRSIQNLSNPSTSSAERRLTTANPISTISDLLDQESSCSSMLSAASSSPSSPSNKSLSDPSSEENEADAEGDGDESGSHSRYTSPAHSPLGFLDRASHRTRLASQFHKIRERTPRASRGSVCGGFTFKSPLVLTISLIVQRIVTLSISSYLEPLVLCPPPLKPFGVCDEVKSTSSSSCSRDESPSRAHERQRSPESCEDLANDEQSDFPTDEFLPPRRTVFPAAPSAGSYRGAVTRPDRSTSHSRRHPSSRHCPAFRNTTNEFPSDSPDMNEIDSEWEKLCGHNAIAQSSRSFGLLKRGDQRRIKKDKTVYTADWFHRRGLHQINFVPSKLNKISTLCISNKGRWNNAHAPWARGEQYFDIRAAFRRSELSVLDSGPDRHMGHVGLGLSASLESPAELYLRTVYFLVFEQGTWPLLSRRARLDYLKGVTSAGSRRIKPSTPPTGFTDADSHQINFVPSKLNKVNIDQNGATIQIPLSAFRTKVAGTMPTPPWARGEQYFDIRAPLSDDRNFQSMDSGPDRHMGHVGLGLSASLESPAEPIPQTNNGHKILQRLGWKRGTGLGSLRQGILDPVGCVKFNQLDKFS
ncbi:hypothetical protein FGIG_00009 [Fasciola gigantica]|uniref:G-patch domain-containing protein n=1 Tax=Fasciola gigantica TaxID=46835 RepID=A0A504YRI4_FASGI|nr:hypothetical protein FGIG_00009 [Fasciola gigantica]